MSEPGSVGPEKTVAAKKPVSTTRKIVSLIVLAGVIAFGCIEVIPKWGYTAAVNALKPRTGDDANDLLTMQEAEKLIAKEPDGSAVDSPQGGRVLAKKTYTWNGLLWHYTLTAYYSKEKEPHLIEYKTEGAEIPSEPVVAPAGTRAPRDGGRSAKKGGSGKAGGKAAASTPPTDAAPDSKAPPPAASDKPAEPKSEPTDKAAAPSKPAPPSDSAPKENPPPPSDKPAPPKPATDPPAPKPSS